VVTPVDPVTLVSSGAFCLAQPGGDMVDGTDGLYVAGRRLLSTCRLRLDGRPLVPIDDHVDDPASATFVTRAGTPPAGTGPIVVRRRYLGDGLRDDVAVRNVGDEATYVSVEVELAGDLADALAVHDRRPDGEPLEPEPLPDGILLALGRGGGRHGCRVTASAGVLVDGATLRWEAIVPARGECAMSLVVAPIVAGEELAPPYALGVPVERSESGERLARWRRGVPAIDTDHHGLALALERSAADLGRLRMLDPQFPERTVVAAGAPWFMALHGRDGALAGWMSLMVDPDLALGTLETLARFQGTDVDDRTEEQPGRILGRIRFGPGGADPRSISYGSVDATPLFVMLLGELRRWGLSPQVTDRLLPHADRALDWIAAHGDRDGDGYVEYRRPTDRGVRHQGWKDGGEPIRFPDGQPARGPIALAEVQAYVFAAYTARAHFAVEAGDDEAAGHWWAQAADLQAAFNRDFWVEDHACVALALDGDKRPVPSPASNVGHCLWTGILDEDKAALVAKQLLGSDLFSGWGVRTLGASAAGYDPVRMHSGAVWPHDTALCIAGLIRYGHVDEAHHLLLAQLEAAGADDGRLRVLCGFDRDDVRAPVRFPDACTTRAWSAAAPLALARALLRFDPHVPQGKVWLAPALPAAIGRLRIERIPLLGGRVTVAVEGDELEVEGLPPGVELVTEPRPPRTAGL